MNAQSAEAPPGADLPKGRKVLILASIMATLFLAALDQTIVAVALPRIVGDLGGISLFVWPFTAYMLASTAIVPVVGSLSDAYGRKPFIMGGILVFLAGSWLCGAATSMEQLIAFRAIQGIGAGLIMTTAFTSVGDLFAPKDRGRWVGLFSGTFGLASVIGPLAGGALTDHASWRWVFYVNIPVALVALALVGFGMPWFRHGRQVTIDWIGAAILVAFTTPLLLGLSWAGNQYGWTEFPVIASFVLAGVGLVAFILREMRVKAPVLPLHLFRNRVYAVSIVATMILGAGMFGAIQFLPLFLQGAQGVSATSSGLVTMPMMFGVVFGSVVTGQLLSRDKNMRAITAAGGLALIVGFFMLSRLEADSSRWATRGYMVLLGLGMGFWMPTFQLAVQNALPHSQLGIGTASVNFFRQIGGTLSVAVFGSLLARWFQANLQEAVPPQYTRVLEDPQILLRPEGVAALAASIDSQEPGTAASVIGAARIALADTVTDIFLVGLAIVTVGLIVGMFLPRVRLNTVEVDATAAAEETSDGQGLPLEPGRQRAPAIE